MDFKEVIEALESKLGHKPSQDEISQELNGVGYMVLAEKIKSNHDLVKAEKCEVLRCPNQATKDGLCLDHYLE